MPETLELQPVRPNRAPWTLHVEDRLLRFEAPDRWQVHEVPHQEAATKLEVVSGGGNKGTLLVRPGGKKLLFTLTPEQRERIERWIGPPTADELRVKLRRRFAFTAPIAALFLFTSLPLPGDPSQGIEPVPFSPFSFVLGATLLVLWTHARLRPRAYLFLLDSAWLALLASDVVFDVLRGGFSPLWLLLAGLLISLVPYGLKQYRRFTQDTADAPEGVRVTPPEPPCDTRTAPGRSVSAATCAARTGRCRRGRSRPRSRSCRLRCGRRSGRPG